MNTIKIALVGAGYMAEEHARAFASFEAFQIVGVCSRTKEKAMLLALQYHTKAFDSIAEMHAQTQADLVIVAVNELSLFEVCQQIFQFPWLCFLEKPVGYNYQQACDISRLAASKDHQAFVAFNRRSYSATRNALSYLQEYTAGGRLVSVSDQQDIHAALSMGQPELVARNYMFANSIHLIDYFNVFCRGSILKVQTTLPWKGMDTDYVIASILYSSGDIGLYQSTWKGPGPWSVSVTNADIRLEMRPLESLKIQKKGERQLQEVPMDPTDSMYKPGLHYQASQILNYFQGRPFALATLEDSLNSMSLCDCLYQLS